MNQLSTCAVTNMAVTPKDVIQGDRAAFLYFYTNGEPDTIYVPVADFLAWKGVHVKSEQFEQAFPARNWTFSYRELAAGKYNSDNLMRVKKSVNGQLLFELDFLINAFESAKNLTVMKALGC